jgi:hypothetical protein
MAQEGEVLMILDDWILSVPVIIHVLASEVLHGNEAGMGGQGRRPRYPRGLQMERTSPLIRWASIKFVQVLPSYHRGPQPLIAIDSDPDHIYGNTSYSLECRVSHN